MDRMILHPWRISCQPGLFLLENFYSYDQDPEEIYVEERFSKQVQDCSAITVGSMGPVAIPFTASSMQCGAGAGDQTGDGVHMTHTYLLPSPTQPLS